MAGSKRNVVFASPSFSEWLWTAVGAVVTVGKPTPFLRRLFQAVCGNHQENIAAGDLCRFPQLRQFPQAFVFLFWFFFLFERVSLVENRAESRYESDTRLHQRFQETFERETHGESCDVCSDDVLRGLDYKDYGHSLSVGVWLGGLQRGIVNVER